MTGIRTTSEVSFDLRVSCYRIGKAIAELKNQGIKVGEKMGQTRLFTDKDVEILKIHLGIKG